MSETPPQQFASYPRNTPAAYGSADKLQALSEGYFGLNWVFLLNIVISVVGNVLIGSNRDMLWPVIAVIFVTMVGATYPFNKKIGYGKDWSDTSVFLASFLMGFNAFCCGIIGFIVLQQIAAKEMKKYGLKGGFLGMKKREVAETVARLRQPQRLP